MQTALRSICLDPPSCYGQAPAKLAAGGTGVIRAGDVQQPVHGSSCAAATVRSTDEGRRPIVPTTVGTTTC